MLIRLLLILPFLLVNLYSDSGSFTTNPTQIQPYSGQVFANVSSCYSKKTNQVFFAWSDITQTYPIYAVYDVSSKTFSTTPIAIPNYGVTGVSFNVYCCYNSSSDQVVFSWGNKDSHDAWYAIYDVKNSTFSTSPSKIANSSVYQNVSCCADNSFNKIIFSWADNSTQRNPTYAIYNVKTASFSTGSTPIPDYTGNGVNSSTFCCYNPDTDTVTFSWTDKSKTYPWYAIYSEKAGYFTTRPTAITEYSNGIRVDVFCTSIDGSSKILLSWADSSNLYPWYVFYNIKRNELTSEPVSIPNSVNGAAINVFSCYNSLTNEVFFSWADTQGNNNPNYAVYNLDKNIFTTVPTQIDTSNYTDGVTSVNYSTFINFTNEVIFSWGSAISGDPYYAIFSEPVTPEILQKRLSSVLNQFGNLKEQK